MQAYFERFTLTMTRNAARACSHPGPCDSDVAALTTPHPYYNTERFPHFVCHHGNWDIYSDDAGHCASIPVKPGCQATHFGDAAYVRVTLGVTVTPRTTCEAPGTAPTTPGNDTP